MTKDVKIKPLLTATESANSWVFLRRAQIAYISWKDSSYVADPPRGFASLEKVMKRQWGSRRDTRKDHATALHSTLWLHENEKKNHYMNQYKAKIIVSAALQSIINEAVALVK